MNVRPGLLVAVAVFGFAVLFFNTSPSSVASAMPAHGKVYCASNDFYRHFCAVDTYGGVELVRQKSEAPCVFNRTYGFTREGIWVDRGCRADFAFGFRPANYAPAYRTYPY